MGPREDDGFPTEAALERTLTVVGPLLRRRARVASPDPAFVGTLRARLLVTGTTPDPAFVRALRVRLRGAADGDAARAGRRRRRLITGMALAAAVLALVAVAAVALVWLDLVVVALVAVLLLAVVSRHRHP